METQNDESSVARAAEGRPERTKGSDQRVSPCKKSQQTQRIDTQALRIFTQGLRIHTQTLSIYTRRGIKISHGSSFPSTHTNSYPLRACTLKTFTSANAYRMGICMSFFQIYRMDSWIIDELINAFYQRSSRILTTNFQSQSTCDEDLFSLRLKMTSLMECT